MKSPNPKTERDVRGSWKSKRAQKLFDAYFPAKKRALSGGRPPYKPEEWAGMLLVVHGGAADMALRDMCDKGVRVRKASKVHSLIQGALNEELALMHGTVTCHACSASFTPTLSCRQRIGVDGDRMWACAGCAPTLEGPPW